MGALLSEWIGPAVILAVIAWALLFAVSAVFHAPYSIYVAAESKSRTLESELADAKAGIVIARQRQRTLDSLASEIQHGVAMNQMIASGRHILPTMLPIYEQWSKRTQQLLSDQVNRDAALRFFSGNQVVVSNSAIRPHLDSLDALKQHIERQLQLLDALSKILQQL